MGIAKETQFSRLPAMVLFVLVVVVTVLLFLISNPEII